MGNIVKNINVYTLISMLITFGVGGCATSSKDFVDQSGPTIKEILEKDRQERFELKLETGIGEGYEGYTRTALNEHKNLFPKLDNPTLVGYVYPHLTKHGIPVPGYSIPFTMYSKQEYSMPGER